MVVICACCGEGFTAKRSSAKWCSPGCRQKGLRRRQAGLSENVVQLGVAPPADEVHGGPVYVATFTELADAGRESTAMGQAALALATRIDSAADTGSSLASAVKQLGATMEVALKGARRAETALDRVRQRRDAKREA